jgi:urea transport system permease protein
LEMVIWVAVGGRGTLAGAVLGAISVNLGRSLLTNYFPELWPFILGGLFVVVVLLFPDGLVGIMRQIQERIRNMRVTALSAEEGLR